MKVIGLLFVMTAFVIAIKIGVEGKSLADTQAWLKQWAHVQQ